MGVQAERPGLALTWSAWTHPLFLMSSRLFGWGICLLKPHTVGAWCVRLRRWSGSKMLPSQGTPKMPGPCAGVGNPRQHSLLLGGGLLRLWWRGARESQRWTGRTDTLMMMRPCWLSRVKRIWRCNRCSSSEVLVTSMSSRLTKMNGMSRSTALEGLSSIFKSERHPEEFEKPKWRDYRRFRDVRRMHRHLVIAAHQVHFGKNALTRQVRWKVLNVWDWIAVGHCSVI